MTKKLKKRVRVYVYLIPFIILFGFGVLNRTTLVLSQGELSKVAELADQGDVFGFVDYSDTVGTFEGAKLPIPSDVLVDNLSENNVLGVANLEERWIEVDLSEQKLRAWDGSSLFLETSISTGLPGTPTPVGEFRIWMKLRATKMEGGSGKYYYYLPNVPYVMFFENGSVPNYKGYGLHGTYWHNSFGIPRSHGCVNLPTSVAKELYYWTAPILPDGKSVIRSSAENLGTRVVIHE